MDDGFILSFYSLDNHYNLEVDLVSICEFRLSMKVTMRVRQENQNICWLREKNSCDIPDRNLTRAT